MTIQIAQNMNGLLLIENDKFSKINRSSQITRNTFVCESFVVIARCVDLFLFTCAFVATNIREHHNNQS